MTLTTLDKLNRLITRCKYSVMIEVNRHCDFYDTTATGLADIIRDGRAESISPETQAKILEMNTIVEIQFYPDTPIGSYSVFSYDIDTALDRALECFKE